MRNDPDFARRARARRASRRYLREARGLADAGNTEAFLLSACRLIQECVGHFRGGEPSSFSRDEVEATPGGLGLPGDVRELADRFFLRAERARYGRESADPAGLRGDLADLERIRSAVIEPERRRKSAPASALLLVAALVGLLPPAETSGAAPAPGGFAAYEKGNFAGATEAFRSAVKESPSSTAFFNLANALYRNGDYAGAVLNYERARALAPRDPDIAANLALAREAAGVKVPEPPPLAPFADMLSHGEAAWLASLAFWLGLALVFLAPGLGWRGFWRNTALFCAAVLLALAVAALVAWSDLRGRAVVMADETPLRLTPTSRGPVEGTLPAAGTVRILGERDGFFRVETRDGRVGWLSADALQPVWP